MAKKNFYAVGIGRVPGIYSSWTEAEPQVKGFQGAKYQGFATLEEAQAFIDNPEYKKAENAEVKTSRIDENYVSQLESLKLVSTGESKSLEGVEGTDYDAIIYVDGSFREHAIEGRDDAGSMAGSYAYGVKIIDNDGVHCFKKAFEPDENSSMRNVAGEIAGATAAINYSLDHDFKNIKLYYDYKGIRLWCEPGEAFDKKGDIIYKEDGTPKMDKQWQATKPGTKKYRDTFYRSREFMKIDFEHTMAHSGIDGNELCDALAKSALHIPDSKLKVYEKEIASAVPYVSNEEKLNQNIIKNVMAQGTALESMNGDNDYSLE